MDTATNFKGFFSSLDPEQKRELAEKAGTSVAYLSQLANGHRRAGADAIVRLCRADSRITFEMLRPEMLEEQPLNGREVA